MRTRSVNGNLLNTNVGKLVELIQFRNQKKEGLGVLNWKRNLQTLKDYQEQTAPKILVKNAIFANQNNYTIILLLE